jgi:hypothetical protein
MMSSSIPPPSQSALLATASSSSSSTTTIDGLISQLKDHINQGRIFDAREVVHQLVRIEKNDTSTTISSKLKGVQHIMDEVIVQSKHVESLLHQLHSDDDWTLANHKSGVTVHYRKESNSNIHIVRATTTYNNFSPTDFVKFCALFVETEYMHIWFPGKIMEPASVLSWHSKYSKVIQLRINIGLPTISPREAIVHGNGYHIPDRNAFLISTKTILDPYCQYCTIPKPSKGVVRIETDSIFYIQLLQSDVISFKIISRDDLKLRYVPTSVMNYLAQGHLPFDIIKTVHKIICNFDGTVWDKKIHERGAYYTEIEDKVYEQLRKWEKDGGNNILKLDLMQQQLTTQEEHYTENEGQSFVFVSDENEEKISLWLNCLMPICSMWLCLSVVVTSLDWKIVMSTPHPYVFYMEKSIGIKVMQMSEIMLGIGNIRLVILSLSLVSVISFVLARQVFSVTNLQRKSIAYTSNNITGNNGPDAIETPEEDVKLLPRDVFGRIKLVGVNDTGLLSTINEESNADCKSASTEEEEDADLPMASIVTMTDVSSTPTRSVISDVTTTPMKSRRKLGLNVRSKLGLPGLKKKNTQIA